MIKLEFNINKVTSTNIDGIPKDDLLSVISETCFLLPVRLIVNNEDIFQISEERKWIELSAFDILLNWKTILKKLPEIGKARIFLADAGQMVIERNKQEMKITTNLNKVVVFTDYDKFCTLIAKSIDKLHNDLRYKFPDVFGIEELQIIEGTQL